MKKDTLEKNKKYSEKFIQLIDDPVVPDSIKNILKKGEVDTFIDLGCGDGILIHALKKEFPKLKITGVDISPRRVRGLKESFPKETFYEKDVCNTRINEKFDFVHSSQVIEHVKSDTKMVEEMRRLLKRNGILFCSSVIKKSWAIYQYRNNGKFVLDPTHEREYRNKKEFLDLFSGNFQLIKSYTTPVIRNKFGISFVIPGFEHVYGIWKLK